MTGNSGQAVYAYKVESVSKPTTSRLYIATVVGAVTSAGNIQMEHNADVAYQKGYELVAVADLDISIGDTTTYYTAGDLAYAWSIEGGSDHATIDPTTGVLTVSSIPTGSYEVLTVRLTATCQGGTHDGTTLTATKKVLLIDPSFRGVKPTGCYGDTVVLNDLESHSWSYYSDTTLPAQLRSLNPIDVRISYSGAGKMFKGAVVADTTGQFVNVDEADVSVSSSERERAYAYYRTLEQDTLTGLYPYRTIPNPFSARPTYEHDPDGKTWRGFYRWRIKAIGGGAMKVRSSAGAVDSVLAVGDLIEAEDSLFFDATDTPRLDLEAVWARAAVVECADVAAINAALTNNSALPYDSHERNFIVITGSGALNGDIGNLNARNATISMNHPNGSRAAGANARLTGSVAVMNGTLKIEHLAMAGSESNYIGGVWAGTSAGSGRNVVVIVGRGVVPYETGDVCAGSASGFRNNRDEGANFNLTNWQPLYRIRVESGVFYHIYGGCYPYAEHLLETVDATFGNDYDRAQDDNTLLQATQSAGINFSSQFIIPGNSTEANKPHFSNITILNGTFVGIASHKDAKIDGVFTLSIPNWRRKMDMYTGQRRLEIYGGILSGISGGGEIRNYWHPGLIMVDIRLHGGTVLGCIYGGMQAESSTTTNLIGSRRVVVTGGTVGGWIAGAANATNEESQDNQVLKGYTYLYLGGNAIIGDGSDKQYNNAPSGNVYGGGIGNSNNELGGACMASNVIVADNADIKGSVFGGGNYGRIKTDINEWAMGSNRDYISHYTDIHLLGGTVQGSVYGANANRAGSNYPVRIFVGHDTTGTAVVKGNIYNGGQNASFSTGGNDFYIQMCAGTVEQNLYGGGQSGNVTGSTDVRLLGGSVQGSVFGGGQSGNVSAGTRVLVGHTDAALYGGGPALGGNLYGGGESGNVTGGYATTQLRRVGSFDGAAHTVYGGGKEGDVVNTRLVMYPTWNTGLDRLYGGGYAGDVTGSANTYIGYTYESSTLDSTGHAMDDAASAYTVRALFGGNDSAGSTAQSNLHINGGHYLNIFGGSDGQQAYLAGSSLPDSPRPTTHIYHCVADDDVFGGGHFGTSWGSDYSNVSVTLNVHDGLFRGSLYGGAKGLLGVDSLHMVVGAKTVNMADGRVEGSVYGGSCSSNDGQPYTLSGTPHTSSTVNISGGTVMENVYGGCYAGMVYGSTNVNVGIEAISGAPTWMAAHDLLINNSVYGGSNWGVSRNAIVFNLPGVSNGRTTIVVDGQGYRTYVDGQTHIDETGWASASNPTMRLRYSIIGSGTSCESGDVYRKVTLRNYGSSACDSAQTLWSIQRADHVLLQNTALRYLGQTDAYYAYPTTNYSLARIDTLTIKGYNVFQLGAPVYKVGVTRFLNKDNDNVVADLAAETPDCGADDCSATGLWSVINPTSPFAYIQVLGGINMDLGKVSGKAYLMSEEGYIASITATGSSDALQPLCTTDDCKQVRTSGENPTLFLTGCGRRTAEVTVVAYNTPYILPEGNKKMNSGTLALAWDTLDLPPVIHHDGLYRMVSHSGELVGISGSFTLLDGALKGSSTSGTPAWEGSDVSTELAASPADRFGLLLGTRSNFGTASEQLLNGSTSTFDLGAIGTATTSGLTFYLTYDTTLNNPLLGDYRFELVEMANDEATSGDTISVTVHLVTIYNKINDMVHELQARKDGQFDAYDTRYRLLSGHRAGMLVDVASVQWEPYDAATMSHYAAAHGYRTLADNYSLTRSVAALDQTIFRMDLRPTEQMGSGISITTGWLNPLRSDLDFYTLAETWGATLASPAPTGLASGEEYLGAFDGRNSSAVRFRLNYTGLPDYPDSTLVGRAIVRFKASEQTGYNRYDTEHPLYFNDTLYVVTFASEAKKGYWINVVTSERLAHVCYDSNYTYGSRPHIDTGMVVDYNGDVHIYNEEGLAWFISMVNGLNGAQARTMFFNKVYLHQKAGGAAYDMSAHYWTPVGRPQHPFMGWFMGAKSNSTERAMVTISGLEVPDELLDYSGLFGITDSARISHIRLSGASIVGSDHVGGIAASATHTRFSNCDIDANSTLGGTHSVGGIAGTVSHCRFDTCKVRAHFKADAVYVGGIVGYGATSVRIGSNEIALDADTNYSVYFGGIAGWLEDEASPLPSKSSAEGTLVANNAVRLRTGSGNLRVGGLVGYAEGVRMENNYIAGTLDGGALTGMAAAVGGEGVSLNCLFYSSDNNYSAIAMPVGTVESSNLASFSGSGNQVVLDTAVFGVNNLTQALNIWVSNQSDDYLGWRSDVRGEGGGLPVFGQAEAVATYHRTDFEQCDSIVYGDSVYTRSTNLYLHHVDSTNFADSVASVWLTVHPSAHLFYTDSTSATDHYSGYGFLLGPDELATLASDGSLRLTHSLTTDFGCDSVVTLQLFYTEPEGIGAAAVPTVVVSPNPTTSLIAIEADGLRRAELMDATGRVVMATDGPVRTLDLRGLAPAPYFLRLVLDDGTSTLVKLIKE